MAAEGTLGLLAGLAAGSITLVGWALDSAIETLASVIVVWRFALPCVRTSTAASSRTRSDRSWACSALGPVPSMWPKAPVCVLRGDFNVDGRLRLVSYE
jgi:hypothetical protein